MYDEHLKESSLGLVSQAFLLTGIAKPTTSADEIFNTIFGEYLEEEDEEGEGDSQISEDSCKGKGPRGYAHMRASWEAKLGSY